MPDGLQDPSVSQTADLLGFSQRHNHLQGFTENGITKRKHPVRRSSCEEETAWLKSGVGGDWVRLRC